MNALSHVGLSLVGVVLLILAAARRWLSRGCDNRSQALLDEWEWYDEPLADPMRAEVRSMVKEFYEQGQEQ